MARRSAAQIAAQKKAAKASAAKRSKASSKQTPMRAHDAPGGGNKTGKWTARLASTRSALAASSPDGKVPSPKFLRQTRVGGKAWAVREFTGSWPEKGQKVTKRATISKKRGSSFPGMPPGW